MLLIEGIALLMYHKHTIVSSLGSPISINATAKNKKKQENQVARITVRRVKQQNENQISE